MLCTSGFVVVDDVTFSHSVTYGVGNICVSAVLQQLVKFPTYLPGGAPLFDFVEYNGGKLRTGDVSDDVVWASPLVGGCSLRYKSRGEVCYDCLVFVFKRLATKAGEH